MGTIDSILDRETPGFDTRQEEELVRALNEEFNFSMVLPRSSDSYYDNLLDQAFIHKAQFENPEDFLALIEHAVSRRPGKNGYMSHDFYNKYMNWRLGELRSSIADLANERLSFVGRRTIITQKGSLINRSNEDMRDYTAIVTLENMNELDSEDEYMRFEVRSNDYENVSGDIFIADGMSNIYYENLKVDGKPAEELDMASEIKLLSSIEKYLEVTNYVPKAYKNRRSYNKGNTSNIRIIDLGKDKTSILPFRYRTFSTQEIRDDECESSLSDLASTCRGLCSTVGENPRYEVHIVEYDGTRRPDNFRWTSVYTAGSAKSERDLDKLVKLTAGRITDTKKSHQRVLVTYEQGYKPLALLGLPPGSPKVPHFRRVRKSVSGGYLNDRILIGGGTPQGRELASRYKGLRKIRDGHNGGFEIFLQGDGGKDYTSQCSDMVKFARDAGMSENNLETMEKTLGLDRQPRSGARSMQLYRVS